MFVFVVVELSELFIYSGYQPLTGYTVWECFLPPGGAFPCGACPPRRRRFPFGGPLLRPCPCGLRSTCICEPASSVVTKPRSDGQRRAILQSAHLRPLQGVWHVVGRARCCHRPSHTRRGTSHRRVVLPPAETRKPPASVGHKVHRKVLSAATSSLCSERPHSQEKL